MRRIRMATLVATALGAVALLWLSGPAWSNAFPGGNDCDKAAGVCSMADQRKILLLIALGLSLTACSCIWSAVTLRHRERVGWLRASLLVLAVGLATAMLIVDPVPHLNHTWEWIPDEGITRAVFLSVLAALGLGCGALFLAVAYRFEHSDRHVRADRGRDHEEGDEESNHARALPTGRAP